MDTSQPDTESERGISRRPTIAWHAVEDIPDRSLITIDLSTGAVRRFRDGDDTTGEVYVPLGSILLGSDEAATRDERAEFDHEQRVDELRQRVESGGSGDSVGDYDAALDAAIRAAADDEDNAANVESHITVITTFEYHYRSDNRHSVASVFADRDRNSNG